ncbi:hypothetical protein VIBNISO65_1280041 [Vibrio nigripulchritudo SO65]|nr:hypothetical protein [Vibrio nigripulchritudo]CCN33607.1 hypothetical protein VIBNIAM115_1230040 [Vibrio nigripulchritudo AM115]CCN44735.1 hypothetical protein VIBNIFTn2_890040 [Vibrio nigripulchritudo FTn2]CCN62995.1 hypothetical protein VIBNIPon4_1070020 [Vibrio nigripulchritudo POn4]CCN75129.1 hypothetical protein VIBNISO65_1280041 [Vibrio nigripulchritudo SO65]
MKLDNGNEPKNYEFGWWPEIAGALMVIAMLTFLFGNAEGLI